MSSGSIPSGSTCCGSSVWWSRAGGRLGRVGRPRLTWSCGRRSGSGAVRRWPTSQFEPFAQQASAQLEELRLGAQEDRIEADLALGRHAELVPELEALVVAHPLRERLRAQLMLALYRAGRQAEALGVYRDTRRLLSGELGIEPTAELRELEGAILRQEPALAPRARGARARVPRPASPLIGRRRELAELQDLFAYRAARLLTLTGPGGSGKTRLALELGWLLAREFRDGVVFVELGPVTRCGARSGDRRRGARARGRGALVGTAYRASGRAGDAARARQLRARARGRPVRLGSLSAPLRACASSRRAARR